ncbi:MAG TPA: hypothetical protein VNO32_03545 [Candidatus Acidoferrum sp.]|nr:hypothetical protein [Candidatus Acidoferrum sp.]
MPDWKTHGLRIIRSGELDNNTPQTPGMTRAEAISHARVGAQKLWAGTVVVHPNAKTGRARSYLRPLALLLPNRAKFWRWRMHGIRRKNTKTRRRSKPCCILTWSTSIMTDQ